MKKVTLDKLKSRRFNMNNQNAIDKAKEHLGKLIEQQFARIEKMKAQTDFIDYSSLKPIVIGVVGGDGIGPFYNCPSPEST